MTKVFNVVSGEWWVVSEKWERRLLRFSLNGSSRLPYGLRRTLHLILWGFSQFLQKFCIGYKDDPLAIYEVIIPSFVWKVIGILKSHVASRCFLLRCSSPLIAGFLGCGKNTSGRSVLTPNTLWLWITDCRLQIADCGLNSLVLSWNSVRGKHWPSSALGAVRKH